MDHVVIGPNPQTTSASKTILTGPILGMTEEEFQKLAASVLIVIPHRPSEGVSGDLALNVGFWARFGSRVAVDEDQFGGFIEHTRAGICKLFQQVKRDNTDVKFLVMIDADEKVPWDAPYRLAAWDLPIVSGVICSWSQGRGIFANVFIKDEYGVARMPSFDKTRKIPGRGLVEAHSVGTGLICIRGDVIDQIVDAGEVPFVMSESDRRSCFDTGVLKVGEDTTFCSQARKLGHKAFVDFSVRGIHYKTIPIMWPESAIDHDLDVRDWKVSPADYHHG